MLLATKKKSTIKNVREKLNMIQTFSSFFKLFEEVSKILYQESVMKLIHLFFTDIIHKNKNKNIMTKTWLKEHKLVEGCVCTLGVCHCFSSANKNKV